ncbi:MAG: LysE family translocator [Nitrospirota bacterium]|nr:LysE family translocator [Nitrospirota bacterium]
MFTVIGILVGDLVFILLAIYSLSAIAESMGNLFVFIKYLGGAYLIWLGIQLWRSKSKSVEIEGIQEVSWWSNFLCGLVITLGDPKAIVFYISFLPAFIELSSASIGDVGIIVLMVFLAVGGVKLGYALMADKARGLFNSPRAKKGINRTAGSVIIGTGIVLVAKT